MQELDIVRQTSPARYEIGVKPNTDLVVGVHSRTMKAVESIVKRGTPLVEGLQSSRELGLPEFIEPTNNEWGFGRILHRIDGKPNWINFDCPLPAFRNEENIETTKVTGRAISATLLILTTALSISEEDTDSEKPQLITIDGMCLGPRLSGYGISVSIGIPLVGWIAKQPRETECVEIVSAMKAAHAHIFGKQPDKFDRFHAMFREKKFILLQVPGNACDLYREVSCYDDKLDRGYRMHPHNVDSSSQQLTLLTGLAAMHDLARKDGF